MLKKIAEWRAEHRYRAEDQDFLSDVNAANLYELPLQSHLILWFFAAFVAVSLVWAGFASLDEVTRGEGKTIPSSQVQVVQNLEGGIVSEILVQEGQLVDKDQVLLQLDQVRFASSFKEAKLKYYELLANTARLNAEINGTPLAIPEEVLKNAPQIAENVRQLLVSKQNEIRSNSDIFAEQVRQKEQEIIEIQSKSDQLARSYKLLQDEVKMSEPLVADGAMSQVELLRLQRAANDLKGDLNSANLAMPRLRSSLDEARNKLAEIKIRYKTEALKELNEVKAELDRTSESAVALEDRVSRTRVLSPVKGTVKRIKVATVGGVIQPGMDLLEIVPLEDQLLIEAKIRPADIAFLRPGQKAVVKLSAYDFSIYGGLDASLEHISADSIPGEKKDEDNYYLIRLRTAKNYLEKGGERLEIIAGMTAEVDILTGKKTVLDYLLKPILKARDRALRER
ncbi:MULTISPECIES: HlyD family type I secretion periplasmic adaptor subunit [Methylomonas]|uniref:Membrane fusion protein (MFP) family protein n=2 Tax=Methylomonas TaxID=416 RepID=A0A126T7E0_9GAMM|nr:MULTISPECIES: HlyD family type I secretion periplasmic adaptor subunit [Methylomonas]AMK77950.1 hemolysin secretion protein D [Methylomonas denitrificans]OAI07745.1 hemolysin secretion protein D [Methylomonas methanica]TCV85483.1 adhesin transport system membrane fusion protein [Methylomonas methanica]